MEHNHMSYKFKRLAGRAVLAVLLPLVLSAVTEQAGAQQAQQQEAQPQRQSERQVAVQGNGSQASNSQTQQGRQLLDEISAVFEQAAAKVNPSVVPIFSEATVSVNQGFGGSGQAPPGLFNDPFLQQFFGGGPQERTVNALGSGVIASEDGYILTNNHVVSQAQKVTVVLPDGERKPAKIVGTDPETDLALIKVDARGLPAATFGDSDTVKIGEWVIAVGNPYELLHTTTAGIISATGRSQVGIADYENFIQTDAAINPGNSGGALADLDGRVIGINAAISTPTGASVGLGFAIPINMAKDVMTQLKEHGKVVRGFLGVILQPLTPDLRKALGLGENVMGVLIGDVQEGTPAAEAGVERGDVITEFNGMPVQSVTHLRNLVAGLAPGTRVQLGIERNGQARTLPVTLGEQPEQLAASTAPEQRGAPNPARLGIAVEDLTPQIAQQLGVQGQTGAVIVEVQPGSAAEQAGLRRGDIIEEVNRKPIRDAQQLVDTIRSLKSGETAALLVQRDENSFFVPIEIP
jgi:serine protease Do